MNVRGCIGSQFSLGGGECIGIRIIRILETCEQCAGFQIRNEVGIRIIEFLLSLNSVRVREPFLTGMEKTLFYCQWYRISILECAIFSFRNGPEAFINKRPM